MIEVMSSVVISTNRRAPSSGNRWRRNNRSVSAFEEGRFFCARVSKKSVAACCTVIAVRVEPGATVAKGDVLLVLEAMKMEHRIHAPHDGVIETVGGQVGDFVPAEAVLVSFVAGGA